jgi:hypothetical protein
MNATLEELLGHMARTPDEFLDAPSVADSEGLDTAALVADLLVSFNGRRPPTKLLQPFLPRYRQPAVVVRLQLIQVACHLLSHAVFRLAPDAAAKALAWLGEGLDALAEVPGVGSARHYVDTPEGREELVRFALRAFGLRPAGETAAQFDDRLQAVSTVERARVVAAARAARERTKKLQQEEARARAVREEMERKAAEAAAAKTSRE